MESKLKIELINLIKEKYEIVLEDISLRQPPKKELWDYSFNCGILSRDLKKSPTMIADDLLSSISDLDLVSSVTNENGFINIFLDKSIFTKAFEVFSYNFLNSKDYLNVWNNEKIIIDYIWANVWKPLHIGHICTPNQGQVMINLHKKLWYEVISDSHIGDWWIIFGKLITAYKHWWDEDKLKNDAVDYLLELYVKITKEIELDKTWDLEEQTRKEFKLLSEWNQESIKLWSSFTKYSIDAMNKILERLNVKPDFNIGESFYEWLWLPKMENYPDLNYDMKTIVSELLSKSIAIENEDNSVWVIFDDITKIPSCILRKRDATHGYLASDLASVKYRMENWSPDKIIYFIDVRQKLHLEQVFEISNNAWWLKREWKKDTFLFHAYNWFISWKEWAFSTRHGNIIKLWDLLDEAENRAKKLIHEKRDDFSEEELKELSNIIGIWAIKYGYLKKSRETDVIFDWDEFMTFEWNSGPYIQYAYVRSLNILKKSWISDFSYSLESNFELQEELDLVKELSNYKDVLLQTADKNMPHILCKYAYDLTKTFSSFYNNVHILNETDESKKLSRLKLIYIFSLVLKDTFSILSIDMPEKM